MSELDHKEDWALKNWCFWSVLLEKTFESPLDSKDIQLVSPKGNQSWIFIRRTGCWSWSSNTLATWYKEPTHWKRPWCWKSLKSGSKGDDRGWMVEWHHRLNGHEFEQTLEMVKDREAWRTAIHWVTKRWTQVSKWTTTTNRSILVLGYYET